MVILGSILFRFEHNAHKQKDNNNNFNPWLFDLWVKILFSYLFLYYKKIPNKLII